MVGMRCPAAYYGPTMARMKELTAPLFPHELPVPAPVRLQLTVEIAQAMARLVLQVDEVANVEQEGEYER
jgi:hypothetical protein